MQLLRFYFTPVRMAKINKTANGEGPWGKGTPHPLLVGLQIAADTMETIVANSQKARSKSMIGLPIPLLSTCPLGLPSYSTHTCSAMGTATLFIVSRDGKSLKCPPSDEWIMKSVVQIYHGLLCVI